MTLPWHKHYHQDAINGMANLPVDLRGVYYTLLDLMYDRREPLAESDQMFAARMCCSVRKWKSYRDQLVNLGKIHFTNEGKLSNKRFENELKTFRKLAENGAKGGRASSETRKKHIKNSDNAENGFKQRGKPQKSESDITDTNVSVGALSASTHDDQPDPMPAKKARRRGSRISANWTPTPKDYAFATSKGLSPEEINDEADRFRNHWSSASKNASKLDWEATWRNWVIRPDFGPVARKAKQQAANAGGGSTMAAALDRVADQLEFGSRPGRGGQELHRAQAYPDRSSGRGETEIIDVDGDVIARAAF